MDCISVIIAINTRNDQNQLDEEYKILTRGQHNVCFDDKWVEPGFLESNESLKSLYRNIKKYIKENYIGEEHSSMKPVTSDSPPPANKNMKKSTKKD